MMELARAALFLGFALCAMLAAVRRGTPRYRQSVNLLLAYAACAGLAVGLVHREAWPFSRWLVFAYPDVPHSIVHLRAFDAAGSEYEVDPRALEPFNPVEFYTWLSLRFRSLPPAQQDEVASYLLQRVERARQRAVKGERIGTFDRYFGPAAEPAHFLFRPQWNDRSSLPTSSFVGLRVYEDSWDVEERHRNPQAFQRRLLYQFPRSP